MKEKNMFTASNCSIKKRQKRCQKRAFRFSAWCWGLSPKFHDDCINIRTVFWFVYLRWIREMIKMDKRSG